ncbi:hypothetical protein RR46_07746 [Papilio xuthus]|uniref:Uncharacterized protein n=1 Tax=Papilio xuthus TaxID=66420 RepID=A0A194QET0_PAPXU|nr:hypothetical protein RR46_07746 [Papilio xuthus]
MEQGVVLWCDSLSRRFRGTMRGRGRGGIDGAVALRMCEAGAPESRAPLLTPVRSPIAASRSAHASRAGHLLTCQPAHRCSIMIHYALLTYIHHHVRECPLNHSNRTKQVDLIGISLVLGAISPI